MSIKQIANALLAMADNKPSIEDIEDITMEAYLLSERPGAQNPRVLDILIRVEGPYILRDLGLTH